jgi:general secretion pathway protein B
VVTESYATFNDLRVQGILSLPDLHLDIHVFSEQAENRFVFVNMSKYKEGAILDEGPAVAEILPEGVILKHRGMTFLLPRE